MTRPIFIDSRHEAFYMNIMDRYPSMDIYREVFFYTMGLSADTRDHITELYAFDEGFISLDNLDAPWQTELTRQICNLAYNLYNGYCDDDGLDGYTPYHIFRSPLAAYFVCAIQMLYTAYFDMLYEPIIVEME